MMKHSQYLPFEEAREFVRTLNITNTRDWKKYVTGRLDGYKEKPDNIPSQPDQRYRREGWINYKNWLLKPPLTYNEANNFVISLGLTTYEEWNNYCKGEIIELATKPRNIARNPDSYYQNKGWVNWEHWLTGKTNKIYGEWLTHVEARTFVRSLKLKNYLEWKAYSKGTLEGYDPRPFNIPSGPDYVYKNKGWISYNDWIHKPSLY